jgi:hypothetical protein
MSLSDATREKNVALAPLLKATTVPGMQNL